MRKLFMTLVLFAFAVPFAVAEDVPNPLAGARTVFINAHPATRHELRAAIARELPSLAFVSRADQADVILELRINLTPTAPQTNQVREVVNIDRYGRLTTLGNGRPVAAVPLAKRPTQLVDGATGVAIRGDVAFVVYHGVTGPFTPSYFAREFVKAWREANAN